MPVDDKFAKGPVTFALAIVKASMLHDRAESSRIQAALRLMFPGVSVIVVAEEDEIANYRRREDLSDFASEATCAVIRSSRICPN